VCEIDINSSIKYHTLTAIFHHFPESMLLIPLGFEVEKTHLPSGIRETLHEEKMSFDELRRLLDYLQHVCFCTEMKMNQFIEAEKESVSEDEGGLNVGVDHLNCRLQIFI